MSEQEVREQREREFRKRQKANRQQQELQQAFNADGTMSESYIDSLITSSDLDTGRAVQDPSSVEGLQSRTVAKLSNLLSRDWVLANLTDAQEHDIRNKLEVMQLKVIGMHPPQGSRLTGEMRAFLLDDEQEQLQPLSQHERILIDELFESLKARLTRGRQGFERKQLNTTIAESRTETDTDDSNDGMLGGLFS